MRRLLFSLALFPCSLLAQTSRSPDQALETGKILAHVTCAADPEQTYALYLPPNYSPDRRWPLVISSDPSARGSAPLELQKDAAELYGYVLASSNNSRNGPWKLGFDATNAMLLDLQTRVSVDTNRIYFAGFSGGARLSAQIATSCKCSAGVLLSGAGFPNGVSPAREIAFPVFSAVGTLDFNYREMIPLQDTLPKAGYPHWLRVFDGPHEWAPAAVMKEALAWFRIQAMKAHRQPVDQKFIEAQFAEAQSRANSFEKDGDLLSAWREYLQIADTFDSLVDVGPIHAKAEALGKEKPVRDAIKREQSEFEEQSQLSASIADGIGGKSSGNATSTQDTQALSAEILHLRQMAEKEKRPEKARVYQRSVSGVLILAIEAGGRFLDSKDYAGAARAFQAATVAEPDSFWAWRQLALSKAYLGQNKETLMALQQARRLTKDLPAFQSWLQADIAFDRLRSSPDFQALLKN